jgi:hypothetical protein
MVRHAGLEPRASRSPGETGRADTGAVYMPALPEARIAIRHAGGRLLAMHISRLMSLRPLHLDEAAPRDGRKMEDVGDAARSMSAIHPAPGIFLRLWPMRTAIFPCVCERI